MHRYQAAGGGLPPNVLVRHGKRNFAIVTLLAYAGLRISEALGLLLTDINLPAREVRVLGKWDKERVVFLNDKIVNAVQEYLGERDSTSPYLFVSRKGGRLDRSAMNRIFNACSDAITPHMLRHFFALPRRRPDTVPAKSQIKRGTPTSIPR